MKILILKMVGELAALEKSHTLKEAVTQGHLTGSTRLV